MSDRQYSPEFIDEMREELESKRADIVNSSRLTRNEMQKREGHLGDSIDESTDEQGTSTELELKDRERNFLNQINDALERIAEDEYGYCITCGNPIGQKRLRARPAASQCIDCREEHERKQRRHHAKKPGMFSPTNRGQ